MDKKTIIIIILVALLVVVSGLALSRMSRDQENNLPGSPSYNVTEEQEEENKQESSEKEKEERLSLKDCAFSFVGKDYERGPLGEEEDEEIYREDAFDSTTLVLTLAAQYNYPENPKEGMKKVNYYPPEEVSYENRLHFSSYRNKVSDYFEDITREVGDGFYKTKEVTLNKKREDEGRLIDIDWEEEVSLDYISAEDVISIISRLPEVVGVMFIKEGDEKMGLDVRHEGVVVNQEEFIHGSSNEGEIIKEDLLDFLEESVYDGVNFFKFKKIDE